MVHSLALPPLRVISPSSSVTKLSRLVKSASKLSLIDPQATGKDRTVVDNPKYSLKSDSMSWVQIVPPSFPDQSRGRMASASEQMPRWRETAKNRVDRWRGSIEEKSARKTRLAKTVGILGAQRFGNGSLGECPPIHFALGVKSSESLAANVLASGFSAVFLRLDDSPPTDSL